MKKRIHLNICVILLAFLFQSGCKEKKLEILKPPELVHCSCDSATYCLTDEDVMNIHAWYASMEHFTYTNRRQK